MSITAQLKQWLLKILPGMNNLVEPRDLQDKWVEVAQNCRFEEEYGAVDKRPPITYLNSTTLGAGAYGITGLHRFYTSAGISTWVAIHNTTAYNITDAGVATAIRTSLTAGKRATFAVYKDLLMASNGSDNIWVYDGSNDVTWELGACKAVSGTANSSLDVGAAYYYAIGLTISGTEFIGGAVSNTVTTTAGTAKEILLTHLPLGPSGTTERKVYRTEGGGTTLKLLVTMTGTACSIATAYADTIGDASLGSNMGDVNDDMPKGAEIRIHRERLFVTRDPSYPNKIYYSEPWLPHVIRQTSQLDYMEISPEDGDEISGCPILLGTMTCIKKNTIRKLHITSATSGADPDTWFAEDPLSWNGCPAPWSITQTPHGIVYLGWDHWYLFNGAGSQPIIDEFDVKDILDSRYSETVGFFHKGVFLAAYTDKVQAGSSHDRIMRYEFNHKSLSYDLWTSSTIAGANCFASKVGDDESGDLYYGDSEKGYVVKEKENENLYRLRTKTECNSGTLTSVFVGGTETSPYIEIGSESAASNIPDGVVIFWDDESTTPGTGWSEITSTYSGMYVKFGSAVATAVAATHGHTMSGSIPTYTGSRSDNGDSEGVATTTSHGHSVSATLSSTSVGPRYANFRAFVSSSCATTEFPEGALVFWDQPTAPSGWEAQSLDGYYVRISSTSLGVGTASTHSHTFTGTTGIANDAGQTAGLPNYAHALHQHTHPFSGTSYNASMSTWELDYVGMTLIKKVGEANTWDGDDEFVYCPCNAAPAGWTAVTTYNDKYLKVATGSISTGAAANAAHTHETTPTTTSNNTQLSSLGGYHTQAIETHTHVITWATSSSTDAGAPATVTFLLYKFTLGKMKTYNAAITVSATGGTWTSPTMQVNVASFGKMYWNEELSGTDDATLYLKTGATSAACAASTAWSTVMTNPNGSTIDATANIWVQYKIELTAADSTVTNPKVYFSDGFVVKYGYFAGATVAETSVNWHYKFGFRNFDAPMEDKIFKKITTVHEGENGSFTVEWETENSDSTFVIDLAKFPDKWDSFFPSSAMGKEVSFGFSKNDLYDFRLREVKGLYSPLPVIV